ncbi:MAG: hypothetical protein ACREHG_00060, partial [Candidatus Saccharimonadales bacterium]
MYFCYSRIKTATGTNATATVTTETATKGQSVYIVAIHYSFDTAVTTGLIGTLTDGTTTLGNWHVFDVRDIEPPTPIKVTPNTAAVISLPAQGTA